MVLTDLNLQNAIWDSNNLDTQDEESLKFCEEKSYEDLDLGNPQTQRYLNHNIKRLMINYKTLEDDNYQQLSSLIKLCPNLEHLSIRSLKNKIEINNDIMDIILSCDNLRMISFNQNVQFDCTYLFNNIDKILNNCRISIARLPSSELEVAYLKMPNEQQRKISVYNFSSELYDRINKCKITRIIDVDLYFHHREFFDDLSEFNISAANVSQLNLGQLELLKKDSRVKQIFIKSGFESDETGYSFTEYEEIIKEVNDIVSRVKYPDANDPDRELKIFFQIYKILGERISYDFYAISENGKQDEKLATDSRSLKNGLLGIERNGKKSYTCLCAGYATILQNICAMLDIKCNYISSSSKEVEDPNHFYFGEHKRVYENGTDDPKGHAYNSVMLDGKQYLCDLTWDSYLLKVNGVLNYFLLSYDDFFESHKQSGFSENNVTVVNLDGKKSYSLNKEDFPESLPTEKLCSLLQIAYKEQLDEMQRTGYLGGFVSQYIDHLKENKSEIGLVDYYEIMKKIRAIEKFVLSDDFKRRGRLSALAIPIDIGNQQKNITFFNPNDSTVEETVESVERMVNHGR